MPKPQLRTVPLASEVRLEVAEQGARHGTPVVMLPGLGPALVVGHSMGTVDAMRLAIDRPELVRGLVLGGAFASFGDNPAIVDFHRDAVAPLRDRLDPAFVADRQRSTLAHEIDPAYFDAIVRESLKIPAVIWRDAFAALLEDDFRSELDRVDAPTLLLRGEADSLVPAADQQRLLAAISGSRHVAYEGAGHALHWEQPQRFASDVQRFAASVSGATR